MSRIAFLGLGNMGRGMAARLLAAGHQLTVHNRTPARAAGLLERGARWADTPAQACAGAEAVICMTADEPASRAMWCGAAGALTAATAPGALALECATLPLGWVRELAAAVRGRALRYLDAPVTGLPEHAAAGTLTFLVGAEPAELSAARPLLECMGERIVHFGPVGSGTTYKLLVNLMGAVQIGSLAEGLALAERAGLDLRQVSAALAAGQAASPQVVRNAARMAAGNHDAPVIFTPRLRLKDVEYALGLAAELGATSPYGELAATQLRELIRRGFGAHNESQIIDVARHPAQPGENTP